jgi:drug/metabolite transporter (DMT)-like permease
MGFEPQSRSLLGLGLATTYLVWGSTFLAIRWAVADIPPFLLIGVRCGLGAMILLTWLRWRGVAVKPGARELRTAAVAGTLMFVGCHGLLAWAEQRVPSGTAALYLTTVPVWLVLFSAMRARRAPRPRVLVGLALGVTGVAVLTVGDGAAYSGGATDRLALLASGFAWAAGSLVALHGTRPASMTHAIALQLGAGAVVVLALSAALGEWGGWTPTEVSARGWAALTFLVLGGTVLGFAAYTWLLHVASPAAAGSYAFVNPVVALGLAWAVGDQALTGWTLIAGTLVLLAVGLSVHRAHGAVELAHPALRPRPLLSGRVP